jgi:hypothetical protein
LNLQNDYASEKLKDFIKTYGSLESNIALHIRLSNRIPEIYEKIKRSKLKSRLFQILMNKIQELERRIDQYISLMFEAEIEIPDSVTNYVRLIDLLEYCESELKPDKKDNPLKRLKEQSKKFKQLEIRYDEDYIFRNEGDTWAVKYNNELKNIKHTKGMDYIAFLLRNQGQKMHSMKMYQAMSGFIPNVDERLSKASPERIESDEGLHVDGKDAFELVDQKDIDSVKNKIKRLEDELNQAMMENDSVRENEISIKLDKLNDYLSKCTYKGKIRTASDATERMRVSIYMAIKTAKNNIKKHHKELFNHLNKFITTGTSISYSPDSPVSWFQDR